MYADPGIAALGRCDTSARTDCGPLIAVIAAGGETRVLVARPSVFFVQRQGLASGEYVVLVVGHRRTYVRAWRVLWRGALAGCSGGVLWPGMPGGVLCFHRRGLRKGLEGQLWAGCSALVGCSGGCFQKDHNFALERVSTKGFGGPHESPKPL